MHDDLDIQLHKAAELLKKGGVIAYPTEAVYGLGCDPYNVDAISRLLLLKQRPITKGFILIASKWEQVSPLIQPVSPHQLTRIFSTWPGPVTWTFPTRPEVPHWIHGKYNTVAIRITAHPIAAKLCELFGGAIVSTSANLDTHPPIRDRRTLELTFNNKVDLIVAGSIGAEKNPTEIRDAISGEVLRR